MPARTKKARQVVPKSQTQKRASPKPLKFTTEGPEIQEGVWLSRDQMKEMQLICHFKDSERARLILAYWPRSNGDCWFDRKTNTVVWRDTLEGENRELLLPKVGEFWTRRRPRVGLQPPTLTAKGYGRVKTHTVKAQLTMPQLKALEKECEALGIQKSEAIRIALSRAGFIPEFDIKI